jgi:hypothetical protein
VKVKDSSIVLEPESHFLFTYCPEPPTPFAAKAEGLQVHVRFFFFFLIFFLSYLFIFIILFFFCLFILNRNIIFYLVVDLKVEMSSLTKVLKK